MQRPWACKQLFLAAPMGFPAPLSTGSSSLEEGQKEGDGSREVVAHWPPPPAPRRVESNLISISHNEILWGRGIK